VKHTSASLENIPWASKQSCAWMQCAWGASVCQWLDFGIYSCRPSDFIYYRIPCNEGIALCSYPAEGSIGYRKVPCPAQSFDVVMKGYFDEGISREW